KQIYTSKIINYTMKQVNKESRRNFIRKSSGATVGLMIPGFYSIEPHRFFESPLKKDEVRNNTEFIKTGFAEVDISPEIGMEQPSGYGKLYHTKFHDPCKVRASVFDDGTNRAAIVGIDAGFIPEWLAESVRKKVQ